MLRATIRESEAKLMDLKRREDLKDALIEKFKAITSTRNNGTGDLPTRLDLPSPVARRAALGRARS